VLIYLGSVFALSPQDPRNRDRIGHQALIFC
jgi:hypothetical protein